MSVVTLGELKTIWEKGLVNTTYTKFKDNFSQFTSLDATKWDSVLGSGAALTTPSTSLLMTSGAVANAETYVLSKDMFKVPCRLSVGLGLSQRVANQSFFIELVSVDPVTGVPDGLHQATWWFDGTTSTTAKYRVQDWGTTALDSGSSTVPTTAGTVSEYSIEIGPEEVWFSGLTIDSTGQKSNTYKRSQNTPDPNATYKIRLRFLNGATAPTTTTATILYVTCQDYAELNAEIIGSRGMGAAGTSLPVVVTNSVAISTLPNTTTHYLNSAATTNVTSVKTTAGNLYAVTWSNMSANPRYLKLYNKASAPTIGTDIPVMVIPLAANASGTIEMGTLGVRFSTGIAYAVTGNSPDADATVIVAGEVKLMAAYV
jgi:hypothetical protein